LLLQRNALDINDSTGNKLGDETAQCPVPPDPDTSLLEDDNRPSRDRCRKTLSRTYSISISNDGVRYTNPLTISVYDCKCMRCLSDGSLQQLVRISAFSLFAIYYLNSIILTAICWPVSCHLRTSYTLWSR